MADLTATLVVHGPDKNGIVAAYSQLLHQNGCGVIDSQQFTDPVAKLFFQRLHFDHITEELAPKIGEISEKLGMMHKLTWSNAPKKKIAIMVSKYDHVLWELLVRHKAGELNCDIVLIISNHPDLEPVAKSFGIPFHVFKITKETKQAKEAEEIALLQENNVNLVVLARYMQIVTDNFCETFSVINIHHSFLPAFVGSKPYHRAFDRGVKLIGATAHYATADLDEGPIIEQDIVRISHRDQVSDLLRKGRLLEKSVLVTAVQAHLDDRVLVYQNKCVVFGE